MNEKLEPDQWDLYKDGLYCGWYSSKKYPKNCIDLAIKKIEKKYGKRLHKLKSK